MENDSAQKDGGGEQGSAEVKKQADGAGGTTVHDAQMVSENGGQNMREIEGEGEGGAGGGGGPPPPNREGEVVGAGGLRSGGEHLGKVMAMDAPKGSWEMPPPPSASFQWYEEGEPAQQEKDKLPQKEGDRRDPSYGGGGSSSSSEEEDVQAVKSGGDGDTEGAEKTVGIVESGESLVESDKIVAVEADKESVNADKEKLPEGSREEGQGSVVTSVGDDEDSTAEKKTPGGAEAAAEREIEVKEVVVEEDKQGERGARKGEEEEEESVEKEGESSGPTTQEEGRPKDAKLEGDGDGEHRASTSELRALPSDKEVEGGGEGERSAKPDPVELPPTTSTSTSKASITNQSVDGDDDSDHHRRSEKLAAVDRALSPVDEHDLSEKKQPMEGRKEEEEASKGEEEESSDVKVREGEVIGAVAGDASVAVRGGGGGGGGGGVSSSRMAKYVPLIVVLVAILAASLWSAIVTVRSLSRPSPFASIHEDPTASLLTALRVQLSDGRHVAYREWGESAQDARHVVIVEHGMISSRKAGIPGVNQDLLRDYGVRLISYDRPGFGQSDPHPSRTLKSQAEDLAELAELVNVSSRFWVLGYSGGGPYALAAARFIPEKIDGVALWAPLGNPYSADLTAEEARSLWSQMPMKLEFTLARLLPWIMPTYMEKSFLPRVWQGIADMGMQVGKKDRDFLKWHGLKRLEEDVRESLRQESGIPIVEEFRMYVRDWGFRLEDLNRNLTASGGEVDVNRNYSDHHEHGEQAAAGGGVGVGGGGFERGEGVHQEKPGKEEETRAPSDGGRQGESGSDLPTDRERSTDGGRGEGGVVEERNEEEEKERKRRSPSPRFLSDIPIHVWHGTDDLLVPMAFSLHMKRVIPRLHLHLLEGHGHFSWFCHCDECHSEFLDTIFGSGDTAAEAGRVKSAGRGRGGGVSPKATDSGKKIGDGGGAEELRSAKEETAPEVEVESPKAATTIPVT